MSAEIPAELRRFIADYLGSIAQLELLLLLVASGDKQWSAGEAAKALYIAPEAALGFLELMRQQGLCAASSESPARYSFKPARPEWVQLAEALAVQYRERRLAVIDVIYSAPAEKFRRFADAFRLREDK
jgi:hypothetical protein